MLCHLLSVRPHSVSFVWLVPPFARVLRVRRLFRGLLWRLVRSASRPGLFVVAVCPLPLLSGGDQQASQVSGMTPTRMPCSLDPGGLPCLASSGTSVLPSAPSTASAPTISDFGALSHGLLVRCLRFAVPALPDSPRKTRFRLVANLCRTGLSPVGSSSKGFCSDLLHRYFLLSQTCPGAQKVRVSADEGSLPRGTSPPPARRHKRRTSLPRSRGARGENFSSEAEKAETSRDLG